MFWTELERMWLMAKPTCHSSSSKIQLSISILLENKTVTFNPPCPVPSSNVCDEVKAYMSSGSIKIQLIMSRNEFSAKIEAKLTSTQVLAKCQSKSSCPTEFTAGGWNQSSQVLKFQWSSFSPIVILQPQAKGIYRIEWPSLFRLFFHNGEVSNLVLIQH